eukprot:2454592-Rhodomonas_salina.2
MAQTALARRRNPPHACATDTQGNTWSLFEDDVVACGHAAIVDVPRHYAHLVPGQQRKGRERKRGGVGWGGGRASERARARWRGREGERERPTDPQTHRHMSRQRDRGTECTQRDRGTVGHRGRGAEGQRRGEEEDRGTERQRQRDRGTERQRDRDRDSNERNHEKTKLQGGAVGGSGRGSRT